MTIYAFKSENREESLANHVLNGLEIVRRLYEEKGYYRLVSMRTDVSAEEFKWSVEAAITLHDVGKAYDRYQGNLLRGKGAPYHEVLSAYCVLKTVKGKLRDPVAFAILLHHHAMRDVATAVTNAEKFLPQNLVSSYWDDMKSIHEMLSLPQPPESVNPEDLDEVLELTVRFQYESRNLLTHKPCNVSLAYAILHPLITADIYAASLASTVAGERNVIFNRIKRHVREFIEPRINFRP